MNFNFVFPIFTREINQLYNYTVFFRIMALIIGSSHKLVVSSLNIISKFNKIFIIGRSRSVSLSQPVCLSCFHSTMSPRLELQSQLRSRSLLSPLPWTILNTVQRRDKKTDKKKKRVGNDLYCRYLFDEYPTVIILHVVCRIRK